MPTYYCSFPSGNIPDSQKNAIAQAITERHTEATGAPGWFVQVIINEGEGQQRYLGGERYDEHVWIRADIRAGRKKEQLESLITNILNDVSKISGISQDDIWIYLNNLEPENMAEYGHILPPPGNEQSWFNALPESLRNRLEALGVHPSRFTL
ncbi:tautomerase family protein [Pectobacterium aroidearum]|uniref:tautomerase family protein n=1 Tax=Pectobacterium aroidearum TaxID=1201031 RepID=UPI0032ED3ACA